MTSVTLTFTIGVLILFQGHCSFSSKQFDCIQFFDLVLSYDFIISYFTLTLVSKTNFIFFPIKYNWQKFNCSLFFSLDLLFDFDLVLPCYAFILVVRKLVKKVSLCNRFSYKWLSTLETILDCSGIPYTWCWRVIENSVGKNCKPKI